jgi:hypothetical protein
MFVSRMVVDDEMHIRSCGHRTIDVISGRQ